MKKLFLLLLLPLFLVGCNEMHYDENLKSELIQINDSGNTKDIATTISPAIVGINAISDFGESVGSGVCVASGGYILTNSHVINDCSEINLYLYDKSTASARVIYEDTVLDLAILKANKSIPYLKLADNDDITLGEDVLAVGTPLSLTLTHTFTKGIVSALNRTLKISTSAGDGYMQNLIQHDASLNPGNSGGPLINAKGEVVGINTLKISSGEGIGFAIPVKSFSSLLGSFVKNISYKVPYLGVYGYDSEIANYYDKTELLSGFYVIDVAENSPLKDAGVDKTCVITSLNGKAITNTLDLKQELYSLNCDDSVYLEFFKDGKIFKTKVKLERV